MKKNEQDLRDLLATITVSCHKCICYQGVYIIELLEREKTDKNI